MVLREIVLITRGCKTCATNCEITFEPPAKLFRIRQDRLHCNTAKHNTTSRKGAFMCDTKL